MHKLQKWLGVVTSGALLMAGIISTLTVPVMAETGSTGPTRSAAVQPTFSSEVEGDESAELWVGHNLLLAGNNIAADTDATEGMLLVAGNTLKVDAASEYGFVAGNVIDFDGSTERDLFVAGNAITLAEDATIGRDVFATGNTVQIETGQLAGNVAISAEAVTIKSTEIAGNLNLSATKIKFDGPVTIAGTLEYNDDAEVSGLSQVSAGAIETYTIEKEDQGATVMTIVYGKLMSIASLFCAIALICLVYKQTHHKVAAVADASAIGATFAIGLGTLVLVPILVIVALITYVAAPLAVVLGVLYGVMVYLAQGFAGLWLGHLILERGFKAKGNVFFEILIGVVILGLVSLVPYLGILTGFLGLTLGLGLIINCIKPHRDQTGSKPGNSTRSKRNAKIATTTDIEEVETLEEE